MSLVIAGFVSYYASSEPDGLEKVAGDQGFIDAAQDSANAALPTADYGIAGVESERLSVGLAGILGRRRDRRGGIRAVLAPRSRQEGARRTAADATSSVNA